MDFVNETGVVAGWTMGFERSGRELVVVAIKATYAIPENGASAALLEDQEALVAADTFSGEAGLSAPLHESDYAHGKPMCDVLLNGSAYAAQGTATKRLVAGMRVGPIVKSFAVVGNRVWRRGVVGVSASEPEPFDVMPVSYDVAFGGVEVEKSNPANVMTFLENPVGRGFSQTKHDIGGKRLPSTEELDKPIIDSRGSYRPMALGPIGRNWLPRVKYAGTYDQRWLEDRAPFWPDDFDQRYFQAAPSDQQIPFPKGSEEIVLKNLTPDGYVAFELPALSMPVWFLPHRGRDTRIEAVLDTILIEPDLGRFMLTWRATLAMRRSCFDIRQVIAGHKSEAWQRARKYGNKPYYRGLAELVAARRGTPQRG
jgi:hypothetical protein